MHTPFSVIQPFPKVVLHQEVVVEEKTTVIGEEGIRVAEENDQQGTTTEKE